MYIDNIGVSYKPLTEAVNINNTVWQERSKVNYTVTFHLPGIPAFPAFPGSPTGPKSPFDPIFPSSPFCPCSPLSPSGPTAPGNPGKPSEPASPFVPSEGLKSIGWLVLLWVR